MDRSHGIFFDEDGNRKMSVRLWDTKQYITKIRKLHNAELYFYAAARDGVRYVVIEEENTTTFTTKKRRTRRGLAVPLYAPINNGTEIIRPFIAFIKAFQQTVEAHKDVPLYDPETAVMYLRDVYTEKEHRERKEAKNNDVSKM